MEIKYSKKKQEIRQDPFMDFLARAKDFTAAKSNTLTGIGIAICLVVAGVVVYGYLQRSGEEKAIEAFGKAMVAYESGDQARAVEALRTVVDNSKNTPQSVYSAYLLGSVLLRQGKYDEAITWFNSAVSGSSKAGFVAADAQEGLAGCFEAKGSRDQALACLSKAVADPRIGYRRATIAWKAALLCREMARTSEAEGYCKTIETDTTADASIYKQNAENLVEEMKDSRSN